MKLTALLTCASVQVSGPRGLRAPSAVSTAAMSPAERTRLWLTEPLLRAALGLVALVSSTDAGLGLFVRRPVRGGQCALCGGVPAVCECDCMPRVHATRSLV